MNDQCKSCTHKDVCAYKEHYEDVVKLYEKAREECAKYPYFKCKIECVQYRKDSIQRSVEDTPTIEAIPKADYEARLKADMVAMLTDIQLEIEEYCNDQYAENEYPAGFAVIDIIQQKINALGGNENA